MDFADMGWGETRFEYGIYMLPIVHRYAMMIRSMDLSDIRKTGDDRWSIVWRDFYGDRKEMDFGWYHHATDFLDKLKREAQLFVYDVYSKEPDPKSLEAEWLWRGFNTVGAIKAA